MSSMTHTFEYWVPSRWNCLGRAKRCGLVWGGVSLEEYFVFCVVGIIAVQIGISLVVQGLLGSKCAVWCNQWW